MPLDRWVSVSAKSLLVVFICVIVIGAVAAPGLADGNTHDGNGNGNTNVDTAHSVTISSSEGSASYFFRATGGLGGGESIESQGDGDDDIGNHRGRGIVTPDNSDTYGFDGQLSLFLSNNTDALTVKVDGESVSIDDIGSPDATMINGSDDTYQPPHIIAITASSNLIGYNFSTTDRLEQTSDVDKDTGDSTSENVANGTVGENGFDTFRYAGEITSFNSERLDDLTVYLDGDRIDPANLGTDGGPSESDEDAGKDMANKNGSGSESGQGSADDTTEGNDSSNGDNSGDGSDGGNSSNEGSSGDGGSSSDGGDGGSGSGSDRNASQESQTAGAAPGDYKIRNLDIGPQPVRAGEEITITIEVSNTAGERILTEVGLATEGEVVSSESVGLFPPGSRKVTFTHSYDAPGTYSIRVGGLNEDGEMTSISRRDPSIEVLPADAEVNRTTETASAGTTSSGTTSPTESGNDTGLNGSLEVTRFSPTQQTIASNESAIWDLVIENRGAQQATGTVTITTNSNETVIREDTLTLAAGDSRGVTFSQEFLDAGNHTVRVGQQSANVSVVENTGEVSVLQTSQPTTETTTAATPVPVTTNSTNATQAVERDISVDTTTTNNTTTPTSSSGSGPGFGPIVALLAVIVGSISLLYRSQRTN